MEANPSPLPFSRPEQGVPQASCSTGLLLPRKAVLGLRGKRLLLNLFPQNQPAGEPCGVGGGCPAEDGCHLLLEKFPEIWPFYLPLGGFGGYSKDYFQAGEV